jgi:hypothetical protein
LESILSSVERATAIIEKTRITHANAHGADSVSNVAEAIEQSVALGAVEAESARVQVSVKYGTAALRARIDEVAAQRAEMNKRRHETPPAS